MNRSEIITEVQKFFTIKELVCKHCLAEFGDRSWQFLQTELLHNLLIIRRDILKVPFVINEGEHTQRGLRCNLCEIVQQKTKANQIYLSAHVNGAGLDPTPQGMTAEQGRQLIRINQHLLPYPIRLEKNVSWIHFDVYDYQNGKKINEF